MFNVLGMRVLDFFLPFARECGDICFISLYGEVLRCGCTGCLFERACACCGPYFPLVTRLAASPFGPPNKAGVHWAKLGCRQRKV